MISIRHETPGDHAGVRAVVREAFGRDDEANLVARLRSSAGVLSLVAHTGEAIVGHVMFSPVAVGAPDVVARGLAPVAVARAWRRRGVGARLIEHGLREVGREGVGLVVVLGDPAYYARFGFVAAAPLGLHCTYGGEDGAFQVLEMTPGAAARCHGAVHYLRAFDELPGG